ncbi:MAG: hypothetical protein Q9Q40_03905 [Acidobacteriota bacterium]|nr:hypothetical protein [Acidobacteriota bacterium]MDQ7087678.1 hypothetical protein [Acidobacteriota bacterium]
MKPGLSEAEQRALAARVESAVLSRLGWRLMRPLLATGLAGTLFFLFQSEIDPTHGITLFLAGAGAFYLVLQLYVAAWTRRAEKAARKAGDALASTGTKE